MATPLYRRRLSRFLVAFTVAICVFSAVSPTDDDLQQEFVRWPKFSVSTSKIKALTPAQRDHGQPVTAIFSHTNGGFLTDWNGFSFVEYRS
jgi:hypothetical protein